MNSIPDTTDKLLERWHKRLREMQASHYEASKPYKNGHYWLGIPALVLSTVVGTSVFASLEKQVDLKVKIFVGLISVVAAVLTALQTFLRFSEVAESHRATAAKAGSLRREIEQILALKERNEIPTQCIDELREKIDSLSENAPNVSERTWKRTLKAINN